jgi:hypothetical protein
VGWSVSGSSRQDRRICLGPQQIDARCMAFLVGISAGGWQTWCINRYADADIGITGTCRLHRRGENTHDFAKESVNGVAGVVENATRR